MQPVHDPQRTIINPKLLMMQVVQLCGRRALPKIITGMVGCGLPELVPYKDVGTDDVRSDDHVPH